MKIKKAVIPAAGFGTRMLPITKTIPKEMLPVLDKPTIQYIVEECSAAGIEDVLIITNRYKGAMDDYFDYNPEIENILTAQGRTSDLANVKHSAELCNVNFVRQKVTKGLGHAVWCAKNFIGNDYFAVLLADDLVRSQKPAISQLIDVYNKYGTSVVGVQEVASENIGRYSSLKIENTDDSSIMRVTDMIEKPKQGEAFSNYAILGRYVLSPEIFDILENTKQGYGGEIQLTDAIKKLSQNQNVYAKIFEGKRYDTGNLLGYLETVFDYALQNPATSNWLKQYIEKISKDTNLQE